MIRDRKGRFSYVKSPALLAERALLSQVRAMLRTFGSDISVGMSSPHLGVGVTLRTHMAGLMEPIRTALAPLVPAGRSVCIYEEKGHAGRFYYSVNVLPAEEFPQATPAAPEVGGPRAGVGA